MIILIVVCLLSLQLAACASTVPNEHDSAQKSVNLQKLKSQAQELSDVTLKGDYARAADLTYPKLVEFLGGRTQYMAKLERLMKETSFAEFQISVGPIGEPRDVVEVNSQYYAIVPTTTKIKVREGTLVGEAFMIGVSTDGGQNWTFVDSGGRSMPKEMLRALFGPAADQLRIPEIKPPVLYSGPEK